MSLKVENTSNNIKMPKLETEEKVKKISLNIQSLKPLDLMSHELNTVPKDLTEFTNLHPLT